LKHAPPNENHDRVCHLIALELEQPAAAALAERSADAPHIALAVDHAMRFRARKPTVD
jgi:hypothetical protein